MPTISARSNINGNTREDFSNAYMALRDAQEAISAAFAILQTDVIHGRNYQHLSDDTLIADRRWTAEHCRTAQALLGEICSGIVDVLDEA
jgi:hypothetical protein